MNTPARLVQALTLARSGIAPALRGGAIFLLATASVACTLNDQLPGPTDAGAEPESPQIYVGALSESDARVAVIATKQHARFYFCGGDESYASLTRWLPVVVMHGSEIEQLQQQDGDWELHASFGGIAPALRGGATLGRGVAGRVTAGDGVERAFTAELVKANTIAGLYEANGDCGKLGLIVTQPTRNAAPAGQGACIAKDPVAVEQVNPVLPISLGADGSVFVTLAGADTEIALHAAAPPVD